MGFETDWNEILSTTLGLNLYFGLDLVTFIEFILMENKMTLITFYRIGVSLR